MRGRAASKRFSGTDAGATGIVVYVPLDGTHSYEEARAFVERVCRLINKSWPEGTTMEWDTSKRAGKVYLDYGMVREGANIASVYSIRPTPQATVGVPVKWPELDEDIEPTDFTIAPPSARMTSSTGEPRMIAAPRALLHASSMSLTAWRSGSFLMD